MIISKTPLRVSFFGGGTDFYEYFEEFGGITISTTIDKYCYVTLTELPAIFDYRYQVTYSIIERVKSLEEMKHPSIKNALFFSGLERARIVYDADMPANSGLGSSSAFVVGLLNCIYTFQNKDFDLKRLTSDAIHVERVLCKEDGGIQDQIACSHGGFNIIKYNSKGYAIQKVTISKARMKQLNNSLVLFFTGFTRISHNISAKQKQNLKSNINHLNKLKEYAYQASIVLQDDSLDLDIFGKLLNDSWLVKKALAKGISNDSIDQIYERAISAGALGGKLLGAGGAGFLLFYVNNSNRESLINSLKDLNQVNFTFTDSASEIIYDSRKER
jgi:D-glycero-alpha-D-manno-heptose-7-phosphate kinase